MANAVITVSPRSVNVSMNVVVARQVPGQPITTQGPVTIRQVSTLRTLANSGIVDLSDVVANGTVANGSTLVYDSNTGDFVIEELPDIDCGSF